MADIADRAEELIEIRIQESLDKRPPQLSAASAEFCVECDTPIPEARRNALPGVQLCIVCQQLHERAAKQYGR